MPSQYAGEQTPLIIASELAAMATVDGGGGTMVIPMIVKDSEE